VCRLNRSLYGLKQAPRAWFTRFTAYLRTLGFVASRSDTSLFILRRGDHLAYLLLYVDDIILTASSAAVLDFVIQSLNREFAMTDLDALHHFLGINVTTTTHAMFPSQEQNTLEILDRAGMLNCKPISTPVDMSAKLSVDTGPLFLDPSLYRSLVDALQYITLTLPDLSYAVQQCCMFMHAPRDCHYQLVKRILRYLRGTTHLGLRIHRDTSTELVA
jgi:hypothetical protein